MISNNRILLHITMIRGENPNIENKMRRIYYRINNILTGREHLPNIAEICKYCDTKNRRLGAYIRNECIAVKNKSIMYARQSDKPNSIIKIIHPSDRKKIRTILFPGVETDIENLNIPESTHNMILRFTENTLQFCAADPHNCPPSFYQKCSSEDTALLYLEALLVDACMCHYLGISDVACFHDEKKNISSEKVQFLKEFVKQNDFQSLNTAAQHLVTNALMVLNEETPYISFLSIFTIARLDFAPDSKFLLFDQYCLLWKKFQIWYFRKHGRYFSAITETGNALETVFYRSKYQGQISPTEISDKIQHYIRNPARRYDEGLLEKESRYAVVILKHLPENKIISEQLEALFPGSLHQSKWKIVYWGDLEKYEKHQHNLEIIPFIIDA